MTLACPTCQNTLAPPRAAKPGVYKPKCPKCGERFELEVFADPSQPPQARSLSPVSQAQSTAHEATLPPPPRASQAEATAAQTAPQALDVTQPPPAARSSAVEATGAWSVSDPAATAPSLAGLSALEQAGNRSQTTPQRSIDATEPGFASAPTRVEGNPRAALPPDAPRQLGGYQILSELGRGAMGSVFLARQLSLNRNVALKTIQSHYADNPAFIARFTREAYAAAQLSHHNVVQIYDLGQERGTQFFSMEFVRGSSLDQIVKSAGKLDAEAAVGYVLQAARGLQFAHQQGLVHRDVKPANLMLSDAGVVKVTDLGLVKTPELARELDAAEAQPAGDAPPGGSSLSAAPANITQVNVAMGTPAYMAPEQAQNAAGVDHRADIYALGCTLYVLLTGRPPFDGASALEVLTKHRTEPVVRPEVIVKRIPPALSEICVKMVAKRPEDRYADMGEVIRALEGFLGLQSSGPFSPREEDASAIEESLAQFNAAPAARLRGLAPLALVAGCWAAAAILLFVDLGWATALAVTPLFAAGSYFLLAGMREPGPVFGGFRQWLFLARWSDWLSWAGGGLLLAIILLLTGWLWAWLAAAALGVGLAFAYRFVVESRLKAERSAALARAETVLRGLRLKGVEEQSLRQFVARYSGQQWEEFFEALFGYAAKLAAREQWGKNNQGQPRPKFRAWRDGFLRHVEQKAAAAREARDRKHLQKVEEENLQAQGLDLISARKQAQRVADALLDQAAELREAAQQPAAAGAMSPALAAMKKRMQQKQMLRDAKEGKYEARRQRLVAAAFSPLAFALGPQMRFLLGCLLLVGCALWARQNGYLSRENLAQAQSAVTTSVQNRSAEGLSSVASLTSGASQPLALPLFGVFFDSFNPGVAGLVLIVLGLFGGWRMSLFALPAAALMVLAPHLGLPGFGLSGGPHYAGLGLGLAVAIVGFFFGRTEEE